MASSLAVAAALSASLATSPSLADGLSWSGHEPVPVPPATLLVDRPTTALAMQDKPTDMERDDDQRKRRKRSRRGPQYDLHPAVADTHRALEIGTTVGLGVAAALGTVAALNQDSLLGDGLCTEGNPIFGTYGCTSFSIVHGMTGVGAAALYASATSFEVILEAHEPGSKAPLDTALTWVHRVLMTLQPVMGLLGAYPSVLGIDDPQAADNWSRAVRSVHSFSGVVLFGTYLTTTAMPNRY